MILRRGYDREFEFKAFRIGAAGSSTGVLEYFLAVCHQGVFDGLPGVGICQ